MEQNEKSGKLLIEGKRILEIYKRRFFMKKTVNVVNTKGDTYGNY